MSNFRLFVPLLVFGLTTHPSARADVCLRSVSDALAVSPEATSCPVPFDLTGTALAFGLRTFPFRDETAGIILENKSTNGVTWSAGDLIRVRGDMTVNPEERHFAFVRHAEILEHRPLPRPASVSGRRILDGKCNFQFVTVKGVVQGILTDDLDGHFVWITLRTADGIVMGAAHDLPFAGYNWRQLVDAEVSLTGLCRPASGWRHGFQPQIILNSLQGVHILHPQPDDPFAPDPRQTMPALHRRRLSGRVLASTATRCYLRTTGGRFVEAEAADGIALPPAGSSLSVAGFPETDCTRLRLTEAVFRPETHRAIPEALPQKVAFGQLFERKSASRGINTDFHGTLVTLGGRVSASVPDATSGRSFGLTDDNRLIIVDCSGLDVALPPDTAIVDVTGVLLAEFEPARPSIAFPVFRTFKLVPRNPADLRIVARPPWWTPLRLLTVLLVLALLLVGVLIWNRSLNVRANRRGAELAREQIAHRAASLKIEERTRLAVEIHDALSQTLTGIALLFDSAADEAATPSLRRFFAVARQMLASCRKELKGCLWDLRTRTFEEKDMTEALRRTLQPYADEADLKIRFNVPREILSETLAHDILRIVRELVVNALRHGHAKNISIAGTRDGDAICFAVEDDGTGFDPKTAPGPRDGHFGLQGIRERLRPHRGTLDLSSARPHGVRARITLKMGDLDNGED